MLLAGVLLIMAYIAAAATVGRSVMLMLPQIYLLVFTYCAWAIQTPRAMVVGDAFMMSIGKTSPSPHPMSLPLKLKFTNLVFYSIFPGLLQLALSRLVYPHLAETIITGLCAVGQTLGGKSPPAVDFDVESLTINANPKCPSFTTGGICLVLSLWKLKDHLSRKHEVVMLCHVISFLLATVTRTSLPFADDSLQETLQGIDF